MQKQRMPSYRHHKPSNQAVVTIGGKDYYLGKFNSAASRHAHERLITEWRGSDDSAAFRSVPVDFTLVELIARYLKYAKSYYGAGRSEYEVITSVMVRLNKQHGRIPCREFGPKRLKEFRNALIEVKRSRNYVNACIGRVRRMFRWGVEEELFPASVAEALSMVGGLRRGKSAAIETDPVRPVPRETFEATLPLLAPVVRAMVELQAWTGMRPGEVCVIRRSMIKTYDNRWEIRLTKHKTDLHGIQRIIPLSDRAFEIIRPFLDRSDDAYIFDPRVAAQGFSRTYSPRRRPTSTVLNTRPRSRTVFGCCSPRGMNTSAASTTTGGSTRTSYACSRKRNRIY